MIAKKPIEFGLGEMILSSAAINPNWILEGNPVARNKFSLRVRTEPRQRGYGIALPGNLIGFMTSMKRSTSLKVL